jgi:hypothetical protein
MAFVLGDVKRVPAPSILRSGERSFLILGSGIRLRRWGLPGVILREDIMTIRFIGTMLCGVLLVLVTTTGGFAQMGGWSPPASSRDIMEHVATIRAEGLYAKCKQQYGVYEPTMTVKASNSLMAACMRNGGRAI